MQRDVRMELGAAAQLLYQQATAAKSTTSLSPQCQLTTIYYIPNPMMVSAGAGSLACKKLRSCLADYFHAG